jgi:hypothetical protein
LKSISTKFSTEEIRDEIGWFADGDITEEKYLPVIKAAVEGSCLTSDRGMQLFVVSIDAANKHNVDTAELISAVDTSYQFNGFDKRSSTCPNYDVPLNAIVNKDIWLKAEEYWTKEDPVLWTAFVWRVAVPLAKRLKLFGSWRRLSM